jgi:hypothetical protein
MTTEAKRRTVAQEEMQHALELFESERQKSLEKYPENGAFYDQVELGNALRHQLNQWRYAETQEEKDR